MKKVRLTKAVRWQRTLGMGSAITVYKPGDYVIGPEISEEAAHHAVATNAGRYILSIEDRETKLAGLERGDSGLHGNGSKPDKRAGRSRKKRKRKDDSDQRPGAVE